MRRDFVIVNVFTRDTFGGNPLAVFPDAEGLGDESMQRIAQQLNLSETTFVLPSKCADHRVRIFTPRFEVPLAGHPTIGTAFVLGRDQTRALSLELGVGPIRVERSSNDEWLMHQPAVEFGRSLDSSLVAASLGLSESDLVEPPCETAKVGAPFAMVALRSVEALGRARFQPGPWSAAGDEATGLYPFAFTGPTEVRARLLGVAGIDEDPATGSAAGPLAAFLFRHGALKGERLTVHQGIEMGRPSRIEVAVDKELKPQVWGACKQVGAGHLDV